MLKRLVQEYEWIHLGIGIGGNATFFVGSIFFLPAFEQIKTLGVWLFIVGSFAMLIGALGSFARRMWSYENASGRSRQGATA